MTHIAGRVRPPYPTLGQAWLLFLIFFAVNMGASLLAVPFQESYPNFGFFLAYSAGMGFTYFIARQLKGRQAGQPVHSFQAGSWAIYPVLLLASWTCLVLITPLVELYPPPDWLQEMLEGLIDTSSPWAFLSIVIAAPIFEELVFRGIVLEGFLKQYSVRKSILWSAFFFGLFHLNPWQFVTAMVLGIFIGWVYHRTRSLLPCMAIHAFANGTSFLLSALLPEETVDKTLLETVGGVGPLLLTIAAAAVVLYFLIRLLDRLLPAAPVAPVPLLEEEGPEAEVISK